MAARRRICGLAVAAFVVGAEMAPAWATTLRVGEHPGFGRVVFSVPDGVKESEAQQGDRLVLHLPGAGVVPGAAQGPSNVGRIDGRKDQVALSLAAGSQVRVWRTGHLIVVDVYGAGPVPLTAPGQAPAAAPPGGAARSPDITLVPVEQSPLPPPAAPPSKQAAPGRVPQPAAAPSPAPLGQAASGQAAPGAASGAASGAAFGAASGQAAETGPADGLVVVRLPDDPGSGEASILVPFDRLVGAAAFARSGLAHVVFDDSKPVDLAALKDDPVFASARVTLMAAATHLTLQLQPGMRLRLRRRPEGWVVAVGADSTAEASAKLSLDKGVLAVAMPFAADTVVMDDPATGGRLLVGTVLGEAPGVAVPHVSPEFTLLPSWAGVAVMAASDRLALRAGKAAFLLRMDAAPALAAQLVDATQSAAEAAALTRRFDFPPLPVPALLTRLRADMRAAGAAPKLGRLGPRLQAAQAMLSLGMDREAGGVLRAAVQDDPGQGAGADAAALLAMANWLAGLEAGGALNDPALGKSDEIALWRALVRPPGGDRRPAAAALASTWRLLLAYPDPLRRRLMRPVADAMLQGGQIGAAEAFMARMPEPSLDDLRAAALVQRGHVPDALALLDKVAGRADRKQAAAAARSAVELRLAAHQITPAEAAATLGKRLYAWRDEPIEIDQRLRVAALRTQAGNWRQALALLRDTEALFPASHDQVRSAELAVIADLLRAGQAQRLPPLDLVALVQESADLLASKDASATLAPVLVDKLLALDLPERAEPILARLMAGTDAAEPKAALGARLAGLRLDAGNPAAAIAALDQSDSTGLPQALQTGRGVLRARAMAESGETGAALSLLATLDGADSLALQAKLLEARKDWHGAETALLALAHETVPPDGALNVAQQDLLLRAASAAAQAGDIAVLQQLQGDAARLDAGPRRALFQALIQQPVQSLTDLPRSGREAEAARAVPAALASFEAH